MELLWNDLSVLRLIHRSTEQVEVAGSIPPPGGCRAAELLDCSAEVEISNCKTETGKLNFEGRLCITIAAADETGRRGCAGYAACSGRCGSFQRKCEH